jgi:hypothetical protein
MAAWLVASPPDGHVPAYFLLNGSSYSLTLSLSRAMSAASCSLMHFAIVASFMPTVETQCPSAQNFLFPDLYLRFACLAGHEECALPLQVPHEARDADLGRMTAGMCTWSGIRCPSIISTTFHWLGCLRIVPRSSRYWLQMAFLPCFGQDTMWCLHIHLVCARLFAFCAIVFSFLSRPAT